MNCDLERALLLEHGRTVLNRLHARFLACSDPNLREQPNGWSIREILGHLVDSVSNNHQRVSRYIPGGNLSFPGYDQNLCVERANYGFFDYDTLLTLWVSYNRLFLHFIEQIPRKDLDISTATIGGSTPLSLSALIADYYDHMERHERQLIRIGGE